MPHDQGKQSDESGPVRLIRSPTGESCARFVHDVEVEHVALSEATHVTLLLGAPLAPLA